MLLLGHVLVLATLRVMPLGDLITDGGTKARSYRYHLNKLLANGGEDGLHWIGSMSGVYDKKAGLNASAGFTVSGDDAWCAGPHRVYGYLQHSYRDIYSWTIGHKTLKLLQASRGSAA